MASTYLSLNIHIVFATKRRAPLIADTFRDDLHAFIGGVARTFGATVFRVGGTADHVHVFASTKASIALADFVRELKKASSRWAVDRSPAFSWQAGYGAFSVSPHDVKSVAAYVARQAEHHHALSSADELRALLKEHDITFDERYFE